MRLALVIASDYHRSTQLPTLSRSLEDADRFAAYLDGSDLEIAIEELSADRYFPEQFEAALREPSDPPVELIVYFAGYVVTASGRDPSLILDGERLGAFALPRLRRLLEEVGSRVLVVIDAVSIAHDGADPSAVADAIGNALGRHGALSVLVNVAAASPEAAHTSFTDLLVFCWDTALKSDASEAELSGLDVFEFMRSEAAFDAFPAARYFAGRVDFDWATGGAAEPDHESSGLRFANEGDLPAPSGNGNGVSWSIMAPPPGPSPFPGARLPSGGVPSPLPAAPEALRAQAASVSFSSLPAFGPAQQMTPPAALRSLELPLRVPPPPPMPSGHGAIPGAALRVPPPPRSVPPLPPSVPPPPVRSVLPPPPFPSAAPPPFPSAAVPRSSVPAPPARSVLPPPPLPSRSAPPPLPGSAAPLPAFSSRPVLSPPLPAPPELDAAAPVDTAAPWRDDYAGEQLPRLQPSVPELEEELTEPGQPFAAVADEGELEPRVNAVAWIPAHHGGFGDAEDTEVTGAFGSRSAHEAAFEPEEDVAAPISEAAPDTVANEALVAAALEIDALLAHPTDAGFEIDALLAHPPLEAAPLEAAPLEAAPLEAAPLEAAPLDAPPADPALADDAAVIDALLASMLPEPAPESVAPAPESVAPEPAPESVAPESALAESAEPDALGDRAPEALGEVAVQLGTGRRTLPSDFVTSVLEEAGVSVSSAPPAAAASELPSVLPPDLVPRSAEADVRPPAPTDPGTVASDELRGALPSDLVQRALEEAGMFASPPAPNGEQDVLASFVLTEAEAIDAASPRGVPETAAEHTSTPAELASDTEPSPLTQADESEADVPSTERTGVGESKAPFVLADEADSERAESERTPSFAAEAEADSERAAEEPMPSFAAEDEADSERAESERMPSFAAEDEADSERAESERMPSFAAEAEADSERAAEEPMPSFAAEDEADSERAESERMPSFALEDESESEGFVGDRLRTPPSLESADEPLPSFEAEGALDPMPSFGSEEYADDTEVYAPSPLRAPLPPPVLPGPLLSPELLSRGALTEGDADAAFGARLPEPPPFEACLMSGDGLLVAGDSAGARAEYEKALTHAPADRAGIVYGRLGAVSRAEGDLDGALTNHEIALELLPGDPGPLVQLTELCLLRGEFARVEGYQRRYLEGQEQPEARAEVWAAMAELWGEHAADPERYRRVLEQWALDLPADVDALSLLATSLHQVGEHAQAIDVRRRLVERLAEPLRRAAELVEMARDICGYLRDADYAVRVSLEALEVHPGASDALEIASTLLEHEERWQELAAIYERVVGGMGDRALQLEVGPKLGALYRDKLGAPDRTISAYERVLEEDPGRGNVRRQLVDLYSARGEHAMALMHCRVVLKTEPSDHELYRKVYSLLDKVGELDAAWNAAMVLDCLGEADINEQLVADAHRPNGLLSPKATVPEEFWGHGLLSPERDHALGEVLASVAEAAVDVRANFLRKKKRFPRLAPEARHDLQTSTTTLAKSLLWTSKLLSVKAPELYVLDEVPGELSAAPSDTPSALVSKSLARGLSLAQLAFLWGRHLTLFRTDHYVAVLYPSVDELVTLVSAALLLGECPRVSEQVASAEVKKLAKDLKKKLHPGSYGRLCAASATFSPAALEGRVRAWLRAVELTAGRAGLLACGDVAVAAELVRRHPVVGQTPQEDQVSDLLCFSVSDEYAKLRGRLGVAIA